MGQQHYRFASSGLKTFAFERTEQLQDALLQEPDSFLPWLWQQYASGANEPHPGLSARTFSHEGRPMALVTLPEPKDIPDAYFVLIAFGTTPPEFYTLEKANLGLSASGTSLGRWLPDRRENLGDGGAPDPDTFLQSVLSRIDNRSSV